MAGKEVTLFFQQLYTVVWVIFFSFVTSNFLVLKEENM